MLRENNGYDIMRKIVVAYATAGIGHRKAALAVKEALDEVAPQHAEISLIDALDYTNPIFKWTYLKLYLLMVNKMPLLWGLLYYITDNFYFNLVVSHLRRLNNWLNSGELVEHLIKSSPDVIISTHFFASEVAADLKKKGLLKSSLITVVTDYMPHAWWISKLTDLYVVGSDDAKDYLARYGVPPSQVRVLGIPVEPIFSRKMDRRAIFAKSHLREGIFTILVIGGGFGVGPIEEIIKGIDGVSKKPIQVIAICGHNKGLVKSLESLKGHLRIEIRIIGFVDNVYEYMEISDILISKSGGITVTESLAKELPMVIISPIIGQETRNAGYLVRNGAAVRIGRVTELKVLLNDLVSHSEKIEAMRTAIRSIRRPSACYDIARLAVGLEEVYGIK